MLNVSPIGDGSIPDDQQKILARSRRVAQLQRRRHLRLAAPGASPAKAPARPAEVPPDWKGGSTADQSTAIKDGRRARASRSPKPASASPPSTATSTPSATAIPAGGSARHQIALRQLRQSRTRHPPRPHPAARHLHSKPPKPSSSPCRRPRPSPTCPIPSASKARTSWELRARYTTKVG